MRANREAFDRWRIVPRMLERRRRARPARDGPRHAAPGAGDARAGRRPVDHPPRRRAGRPARGRGRGRRPDPSSAPRRRTRWRRSRQQLGDGAALVPALLAAATPELAASLVRRAEAAGYSAIVVTLDTAHARLAPARPAAGLPAVPARGSASPTTSPTRSSARRSNSRPRRTCRPRSGTSSAMLLQPDARRGTTSRALRGRRDLPIVLKGDPAPRRRAPRASTRASTASSSPTTAAARSTARSPRSTRCPAWSRRWATTCRCCWTAACARAPTRQGARARRQGRARRPPVRVGPRARRPAGREGGRAWPSGRHRSDDGRVRQEEPCGDWSRSPSPSALTPSLHERMLGVAAFSIDAHAPRICGQPIRGSTEDLT